MKRRREYGEKDGRSTEIPNHQPGELIDHFRIRIVAITKTVYQQGTLGRKLSLDLCLGLRPVHSLEPG